MIFAAALAGCGSSGGKTPHDAAADAADARASDGAPAVGDGPAEALDAPAGDHADGAGPDAAACTPACGAQQACVKGDCLPAPVVLARAPGCGAARLALRGGFLYWTEQATGTIKRLPVGQAGVAPTVVVSGQPMPVLLAVDDSTVYWSNQDDRSIWKVAVSAIGGDGGVPDGGLTDGGVAQLVVTAPATANALLANSGVLYYAAGPSAWKLASPNTAPLLLASFATCRTSKPAGFALDDTHLYQTDTSNQFITRELINGAQANNDPCAADPTTAPKVPVPDTISHSQGELLLDTLAVSGGEVFWADHGTISAKPVDGTTSSGARQVVLAAGSNSITGFVLSGGFVYFAEGADFDDETAANTIQFAPTDPGEAGADDARVIAEGQPNAQSFAADVAHLYWTTHAPSATAGAADDCAIVSLSK